MVVAPNQALKLTHAGTARIPVVAKQQVGVQRSCQGNGLLLAVAQRAEIGIGLGRLVDLKPDRRGLDECVNRFGA